MKDELRRLLSGLYTDALMALDDTWDRSDHGFKCQISLIEKFATEFDIELEDTRKIRDSD